VDQISDEMNEILKLAVIESGNIELFEYSLLVNPKNIEELPKYGLNKEINQLMAYLSRGLIGNAMFSSISMALHERVKGDIITKFNKKSV
jgi:hypothetical protein